MEPPVIVIVPEVGAKVSLLFTVNVPATEKEVVGSAGNTLRIDRLIVKENEVWIIDYKSSRDEPEKHRAQIEEYIEAVRDLYPGKTVKGFLLYLDEMTLNEVGDISKIKMQKSKPQTKI